MSAKLANLIGIQVVGLHQGQRFPSPSETPATRQKSVTH